MKWRAERLGLQKSRPAQGGGPRPLHVRTNQPISARPAVVACLRAFLLLASGSTVCFRSGTFPLVHGAHFRPPLPRVRASRPARGRCCASGHIFPCLSILSPDPDARTAIVSGASSPLRDCDGPCLALPRSACGVFSIPSSLTGHRAHAEQQSAGLFRGHEQHTPHRRSSSSSALAIFRQTAISHVVSIEDVAPVKKYRIDATLNLMKHLPQSYHIQGPPSHTISDSAPLDLRFTSLCFVQVVQLHKSQCRPITPLLDAGSQPCLMLMTNRESMSSGGLLLYGRAVVIVTVVLYYHTPWSRSQAYRTRITIRTSFVAPLQPSRVKSYTSVSFSSPSALVHTESLIMNRMGHDGVRR